MRDDRRDLRSFYIFLEVLNTPSDDQAPITELLLKHRTFRMFLETLSGDWRLLGRCDFEVYLQHMKGLCRHNEPQRQIITNLPLRKVKCCRSVMALGEERAAF